MEQPGQVEPEAQGVAPMEVDNALPEASSATFPMDTEEETSLDQTSPVPHADTAISEIPAVSAGLEAVERASSVPFVLPDDWTVEEKVGARVGRGGNSIYVSPSNKRFYSIEEVRSYLLVSFLSSVYFHCHPLPDSL